MHGPWRPTSPPQRAKSSPLAEPPGAAARALRCVLHSTRTRQWKLATLNSIPAGTHLSLFTAPPCLNHAHGAYRHTLQINRHGQEQHLRWTRKSSHKICVVVGEAKKDGAIKILGVGQAPSRGVRKGEIVDFETVQTCLNDALVRAEDRSDVMIRNVFLWRQRCPHRKPQQPRLPPPPR